MTFQYYCQVNMPECQREKKSQYPLLVEFLTEENVLALKTFPELTNSSRCGIGRTRVAFWIQAV